MSHMPESNYWKDRWKARNIGWHQSEVESLLQEFFPKLSGGRVFVPLCGKSLDMVWLAHQGCTVVGVELSPIACEEFFLENYPDEKVKPEKSGHYQIYQGSKVTIYCGDVLDLGAEQLAGVNALYDRAALIALPPAVRIRYAAHIKSLFKTGSDHPGMRALLITITHAGNAEDGPPYSVTPEEVTRLYSDSFQIEPMNLPDQSEFTVRTHQSGEMKATEHVFRMKLI